MDRQNVANIIGIALGSVVGGTISYGIYGTLRDKQWSPWGAGAATGGASAVLAIGLTMLMNKINTPATAGLPHASNLRVLSRGLTSAAVGAMAPGIPRLGPVRVGAYIANPVGAYTSRRVGCANC